MCVAQMSRSVLHHFTRLTGQGAFLAGARIRGRRLPAHRPILVVASLLGAFAVLLAPSGAPTAFAALPYSEGGPAVVDPGVGYTARYVDATGGSDSNDGTSPQQAWQTLSEVNANIDSLPAGAMVLFKRGEEFEGSLSTNNNGTPGNRITIGAYGTVTDPRPKFTDPGQPDDDAEAALAVTDDGSYIMVRDIECARIVLDCGANNVVVYNCVVHGSKNIGIYSGGGTHHNAIVGNLVYDMQTNDGIGIHDSDWEPDPNHWYVEDSFWVVDNVVIGSDTMEECYDQATLRTDPYASDFKVINNRFQCRSVSPSTNGGSASGGIAANYGTKYAWFIGNIISEAVSRGMYVGAISGEGNPFDTVGACDDIQISGNILFTQTDYSGGGRILPRDTLGINTSDGLVAHNTIVNISSGRAAMLVHNSARTTTVTHNLFARDDGDWMNLNPAPDTAFTSSDYNWFDDLADGGSYWLDGITLANWQSTYGFDTNSGTGDSGISIPPSTTYNDNPYNWYDSQFLDYFTPDSQWSGCDGADTPGSLDCSGNGIGRTMIAFSGLAENGGYGWEGPALVQERYPLIGSAPVANFTANPTSGNVPLTVYFSDASLNSPTSWSWSFGDSGTSTTQNPSHEYTSTGSYTVSLSAANAVGSDGETKTDYITATTGVAPVADFSGSPTSGSEPLTVNFTDSSTNTPTSWSWNFGDAQTSTAQNPSHQYTAAGTYSVTLTAANAYGSDGETKTDYITVGASGSEVLEYADAIYEVCTPGSTSGSLSDTQTSNDAYYSFSTAGNGGYEWTFNTAYTPEDLSELKVELEMKASTTLTTLQVQIYNTGTGWDTIRTGEWTYTTDTWFDTWDTSSISTYMSGAGTVRLRIRGCTGGSFTLYHDTVRLRLTMQGDPPVANFTASPTSGTAPLTVNFTDGSTQTPTSWSWSFGDSTTSTAQNPSHQYTSTGSFTVSLTATNAYGSDGETKTNYITVDVPAPVADFSANPTSGSAPLTVNFTDSSTNSPTSWSWDFGDSSTSTSQNPSHQYASTGNYTVSLTATNATGSDGETKTNYITVNVPAPVADFSGTPTSGTVPLTVNFTDTSINSPTSWSWNFGDSTTSTSQNPSHQYTSAGTYTVVLTATNATGSDDETKTGYITVHPPTPVADFTASPTSGTAPMTVNFTDTSTNSPTSWSWSFGDSSTSALQNPTHQYTSAGTYTVSLTATNATGSDGETKTNYITVNVPAPVANFTADTTSGTAPLTVSFTDTSTNSPTSWSWDFGDGSTSTSQNPSHQYTSANNYTVALTSTNAGGSDTETKINYITVTVSGGNGVTVYPDTYSLSGNCSVQSGSLSDLQTDNDSYMVIRCDTYNHEYSVRYTADTNYVPGQVTRITVDYQAKRDLTGTPSTGILFVRTASGGWGFQDLWLPGTTDSDWTWTTTNVSAWMSSDGVIGFELCGCPDGTSNYEISSDMLRFTLELAGSAPVANFTADTTAGTAPLTVNFTDTSTNTPTSWSWGFGDSSTSTSQNPSHQYTSTGNYTVSLTATNASGSDGETKTNYITVNVPAPVANFTADTTAGTAPLTVSFTDTSINSPTSWSWNFGDSSTSTSQNPSHQYANAGTYTVSLTATNASGSDGETKTDYITVSPAQSSIFSDGFESSLDWTTSGDVTWYTSTPKIGTHSVRLRYTGSIQKTISTVGYENITVSFYLGAGSLDNSSENVQCLWYDGSAWTLLEQINDGDPEEDGGLHAFSFSMPSAADDNADFALRFKINGSGTGDYAYVDNVAVEGDPVTYVYPTSKARRCDWSPSGGLSDVQTSDDVYFSFNSDDDYGGYDWYFDTEYAAAQLSKIEVELELKTSRSDTPALGVNIWNYSISDWTIIRTAAPWSTTDDWIEWETSNVSDYMDNDGVVRLLIGGCPVNSNDWTLYHDVVRLRLTPAE